MITLSRSTWQCADLRIHYAKNEPIQHHSEPVGEASTRDSINEIYVTVFPSCESANDLVGSSRFFK
jgi:hypothetical protein